MRWMATPSIRLSTLTALEIFAESGHTLKSLMQSSGPIDAILDVMISSQNHRGKAYV